MNNYRLLIVGILIFVGSNLFGQRCSYEKNKIDPATKLEVKRTRYSEITRINNHPLYVKGQCIGARKYLKIRYYIKPGSNIDDMKPLKITFKDNSFVLLNALPITTGPSLNNPLTKISSLLIYKLTKEQYSLLINNNIKQLEIQTTNGITLTKTLRKRFEDKIKKIMLCILLDSDK